MRILVDMDCILVDTMGEFIPRFNRLTGADLHLEDITTFEIKEVVGPELAPYVSQVFLQDDFFHSLKPLPGAVEAFHELRKHHEVRVATTAYGPESAKAKLMWCDRYLNGLARGDVVISGKKERIDADALIDDKPSTIHAWKATVWRMSISIAWPWNGELKGVSTLHAQSGARSEEAWRKICDYLG